MALDILGEHIIEELDRDLKKTKDIRDFKDTLKQVKKWFKAHPDITKALTTTTPELNNIND